MDRAGQVFGVLSTNQTQYTLIEQSVFTITGMFSNGKWNDDLQFLQKVGECIATYLVGNFCDYKN